MEPLLRILLGNMVWSSLGTQFCLELAFGVLVTMAAVARAPVRIGEHQPHLRLAVCGMRVLAVLVV